MTVEQEQAILNDPNSSQWLKDAVIALRQRDPAEALRDTKVLYALQQIRAEIYK